MYVTSWCSTVALIVDFFQPVLHFHALFKVGLQLTQGSLPDFNSLKPPFHR